MTSVATGLYIKHDVTNRAIGYSLVPTNNLSSLPVSNRASILEAMKYRRWERPGNEAKLAICCSSLAKLILLLYFHPHHLQCPVGVCSTGISPWKAGRGLGTRLHISLGHWSLHLLPGKLECVCSYCGG